MLTSASGRGKVSDQGGDHLPVAEPREVDVSFEHHEPCVRNCGAQLEPDGARDRVVVATVDHQRRGGHLRKVLADVASVSRIEQRCRHFAACGLSLKEHQIVAECRVVAGHEDASERARPDAPARTHQRD
jgi:hypothetical protein